MRWENVRGRECCDDCLATMLPGFGEVALGRRRSICPSEASRIGYLEMVSTPRLWVRVEEADLYDVP